MMPEEELLELRQENKDLRKRLTQQDELIAHLQQRVQALEERLAKDSHNSHLPPSSEAGVTKQACVPKPLLIERRTKQWKLRITLLS